MWTASARHQYRRSGGRYATDVTDAEFALLEPLLPPAKRGGRRSGTSLREVLNALLYLLRTGCPWRMLPCEFPPRSTVYGYFRRFWQEGIWSNIQMTLLMAARQQAGRGGTADRRDHRQPERQDDRSRRPARLRRRQEGQRPQAAPSNRHAGVAAAAGSPSRQRPGP